MAGLSAHEMADSFNADPLNLIVALESWRDDSQDMLDSLFAGGKGRWHPEFSTVTRAIALWCNSGGRQLNPEPFTEFERLLRDRINPTRIYDPENPKGFRLPPQLPDELLERKREAAHSLFCQLHDLGNYLCRKSKSSNRRNDEPDEADVAAVRSVLEQMHNHDMKRDELAKELRKRRIRISSPKLSRVLKKLVEEGFRKTRSRRSRGTN